MSSRNSSESRPAACAISSAKLCAANAWKLLLTARNQPMRTCASAGPFSARMFGTSYGRSVEPEIELEAERLARARRERRGDRRKRRPVQPRRRLAAAVDRRLVIHRRRRVVVVETDVVFARPDHLDRLAELLRQHRRFGAIVRLRLAAEAAAEQRHVAGDVLLVDAQRRRHRFLHRLRILRRRPDRDLAVLEFGHRRRRLHRGVRRQRRVVGRLEHLAASWRTRRRRCRGCGRPCPACWTVAISCFLNASDSKRAVRAVVPLDLQLPAPLERRPGVVGDHRDAAERLEQMRRLERVERHRLLHALDAFRAPRRPASSTVPPSTGGCSIDACTIPSRKMSRPNCALPVTMSFWS